MILTRRAVCICLAAAAAFLLIVPAAGADVFTVTRPDDPVPGACSPTDCSLREAVLTSNNSAGIDDVIVLPASVVPYTVNGETLKLTDDVELRGAGADRSVIVGDGGSFVFHVFSAETLIDGVAITDGKGAILDDGGLTLRGVSIEHNVNSAGGGGIESHIPITIESSFIGFNHGGGVVGGGIQATAAVTLVNSTVAANTSDAGAVRVFAPITITNSAIVGNLSSSTNAGSLQAPAMNVRNSIFAANTNLKGVLNCEFPFTSLGGNVEDTTGCGTGPGDRTNANVGLGPLALNGGPTLNYSLLPGSAAIDFATACPAADQRGVNRPQAGACDSGPFELPPLLESPPVRPPPPLPTPMTPPPGDHSLALQVSGGKLNLSRGGIARLKLSCPSTEATGPCSGEVVLGTRGKVQLGSKRLKGLRLASAHFSVDAGKSAGVKLRLSAANAALVRSSQAARNVVAEVRATDGAGNAQLIEKKLSLVPR